MGSPRKPAFVLPSRSRFENILTRIGSPRMLCPRTRCKLSFAADGRPHTTDVGRATVSRRNRTIPRRGAPWRNGNRVQEKGRLQASFELVGLGEAPRPKLRVEIVDPLGKRQPVEVSDKGEFTLDEENVGKGYMLEVGGPGGGRDAQIRLRPVRRKDRRKDGVYRLPELSWKKFWI